MKYKTRATPSAKIKTQLSAPMLGFWCQVPRASISSSLHRAPPSPPLSTACLHLRSPPSPPLSSVRLNLLRQLQLVTAQDKMARFLRHRNRVIFAPLF